MVSSAKHKNSQVASHISHCRLVSSTQCSTDSIESEGVVAEIYVLPSVFDENTLSPTIEPASLDELEKQQNDWYYDFHQ